jgi:hypothetical protein
MGGRYKLKILTPLRGIQPPSAISLSSIKVGSPGDQVICSTARLMLSHADAVVFFPSEPITGGTREFTLAAGHSSRDGMKM